MHKSYERNIDQVFNYLFQHIFIELQMTLSCTPNVIKVKCYESLIIIIFHKPYLLEITILDYWFIVIIGLLLSDIVCPQ